MSEGDFVSMGFFEKYDLYAVVKYLQTIKYINKLVIKLTTIILNIIRIFLWGRSMGAATILMFLQEFQLNISAICIDSCFSDLEVLLSDFSSKYFTKVE